MTIPVEIVMGSVSFAKGDLNVLPRCGIQALLSRPLASAGLASSVAEMNVYLQATATAVDAYTK